jgi:hypothetical protein
VVPSTTKTTNKGYNSDEGFKPMVSVIFIVKEVLGSKLVL